MQQMHAISIFSISLSTLSIKKAPFAGLFSTPSIFPPSPLMLPEMEKPRVTEIKVRMDCNGCVQKIKKALNGITGIYKIDVDFPQQKITIIGWADPEKLVKAIKKTRKSAVICVHTEQSDQPTPEGAAAPEGGAPPPSPPPPPPPEPTNPPAEPETEAAPPAEAPNKQPEPENPPPESANDAASQSHQQSKQPKDLEEEVHVIYRRPTDHGYRYSRQLYSSDGGPGFREEWSQPQEPAFVTHSYNTYKPTPHVFTGFRGEQPSQQPEPVYVTHSYNREPVSVTHSYDTYNSTPHIYTGFRGESSQRPEPVYVTHSYNTYKPTPFVTEYAYPRSPTGFSFYSRQDNYSQDYYYRNYGNGNITSMFSEENPNACRIA